MGIHSDAPVAVRGGHVRIPKEVRCDESCSTEARLHPEHWGWPPSSFGVSSAKHGLGTGLTASSSSIAESAKYPSRRTHWNWSNFVAYSVTSDQHIRQEEQRIDNQPARWRVIAQRTLTCADLYRPFDYDKWMKIVKMNCSRPFARSWMIKRNGTELRSRRPTN